MKIVNNTHSQSKSRESKVEELKSREVRELRTSRPTTPRLVSRARFLASLGMTNSSEELATSRLLDSSTSLKLQLQPVVSQSHVRRKLGVGFLVSQLVSDVRAVASANPQPLHHPERLLDGQVGGVGPGP